MIRPLIAVLTILALAEPAAAEGLDEATIQSDAGSGLSRLLARAGFGELQKSYALVVGISDFEDYADLPTADDPIRMRDYLINEAGFDYVHILTGEKVTKARLEELMLDEFRPLVGESDRFLFYWSGHGETLEVGNGTVGFLPLADSRKTVFSSMVAMSDVARWDNFLAAHQILYLLDSCFSGLAGAAPQSDLAAITREQLSGPSRHVITAGRGDEQTIAVDSLGGSVFTHAVLKGLRGGADTRNALGADGLVTVGELKDYVSQEVGRLRIGFNWQKSITPQIRDLSGSDGAFFFPVASSFPDGADTAEGPGTVVPQGGDADLIEVQRSLISLGYDPGPPDGMLSFATRRALAAFQSDRELPLSGVADEDTVLALLLAMNQGPEEPAPQVPSVDPILGDPVAGDPEPRPQAPCADCPEMIAVPGGRFTLGRDDGKPEQGPAREIEVAPFQIARTETTMGLFRRYIEENGLDFVSRKVEPDPTCYEWTDDNRLRRTAFAYNEMRNTPDDIPVSCVNREDVDDFIAWLNERVEGPAFRLPTEAEFEWLLARPDATLPFLAGPPDAAGACAVANVADASSQFAWRNGACADGHPGVGPVAQYPADVSGLSDLSGNLWEWVSDCWHDTHATEAPAPPCETGTVKGASFDDPLENLHPSVRQPVPSKRRQTNIGFRVARDAG